MQVNYKTKRGAILLNRIGEDFKVKVGEGLTTGSFISDILKEHHMTLYHNGAKTFDWAKRYDNLHKLLQSDCKLTVGLRKINTRFENFTKLF